MVGEASESELTCLSYGTSESEVRMRSVKTIHDGYLGS